MDEASYLTPKEVADLYNLTKGMVLEACRMREMQHVRLGYRTIRIQPDWAQAWIDRRTEDAKVT
jgi:excisionase family DNA binding protein